MLKSEGLQGRKQTNFNAYTFYLLSRDYENNTWVRAPLAHFANHYGTAEATKKTWMGLNSAPQAKTMEIVIDKIRELTEKKLKSNFDTVTVFTGTGFKPM